ncbi:hypothetical protein K2173_002608 [Erythroxylum novogranatense]|uniref:Fe-S metabolism associated domain-containing protein n=1 Tax=Erythroxylum novogranatense TaxID=1862640 RepID=A0AAV8SXR5_9ROSI|nr:hypothetical protein K2173_002608 [Erythroxylum novogranatense]
MNSAALKTLPFLLLRPPSRTFTHLKRTQPMISTCNTNPDLKSDTKTSNLSVPSFAKTETPVATASFSCSAAQDPVSVRLRRLVVEFKSLTEPIDRVKRLLDYAARLPPFDESTCLPENRVVGCTTQVWVEVKMDENGRMRFRADSDSEITKGFLSCLIWLLDGATAEEVMAVQAEELEAVNVGMHGRVQSRVNTWHNILISMQKRTESLVAEQIGRSPEGQLIPLIVDGLGDDGSLNDTQVQQSRQQELDANLSRP